MKGIYIRRVSGREDAILPVLDQLSESFPQLQFGTGGCYIEYPPFGSVDTYNRFFISVDGRTTGFIIPDLRSYKEARDAHLNYQLGESAIKLESKEGGVDKQIIVIYRNICFPKQSIWFVPRDEIAPGSIVRISVDAKSAPYVAIPDITFKSMEQVKKELETAHAKVEEEKMQDEQYQKRVEQASGIFGDLERLILDLGYQRVK